MTDKQNKHIAKIIERELGFTNGWSIDDKAYTEHCLKAAKKIDNYLRKGLKISSKRVVSRSSKACPYDDFACRVYSFCGTKKCYAKKK